MQDAYALEAQGQSVADTGSHWGRRGCSANRGPFPERSRHNILHTMMHPPAKSLLDALHGAHHPPRNRVAPFFLNRGRLQSPSQGYPKQSTFAQPAARSDFEFIVRPTATLCPVQGSSGGGVLCRGGPGANQPRVRHVRVYRHVNDQARPCSDAALDSQRQAVVNPSMLLAEYQPGTSRLFQLAVADRA